MKLNISRIFLLFISVMLPSIYSASAAKVIYSPQGSPFNVKNYGAKGDGTTIDTRSINSAVEAASNAGGGTVYFPAGNYLTGSIHLKNNISLYIDQGATIVAAPFIPEAGYDDPETPSTDNPYHNYGHHHWHNSLFSLKAAEKVVPDADNAGLKLPAGFGALKVAETGVKTRHLVVTPEGYIYVKLAKVPKEGKGIWVLKEGAGGKATFKTSFGNYGGTGIAIKDGYLYASSNTEVFRYKLNGQNEVINPDEPEKIVTGLKAGKQHETKSIVLDNKGNIYVNIGAWFNSCQYQDRGLHSPGIPGCPILDSMGGIWQFRADKPNQSYGDGVHYASGIRNVVGLDWNQQDDQLFVMQHGRDNLNSSWPELFTAQQSAELPAECMYSLKKGDNAGWPFMYYDQIQHKKIQAPEYGGNGKKEADAKYIDPVAAYPGHMAPNGLLFYTGNMFPEHYKNGAFIAFHGSWNRAPEPQKGYFVVFQPFKNGKPSGNWEVFAEGFAGVDQVKSPGQAQHRPCGLAQGPDGSLYVTDDVKGTIYRIIYTGK
jgi:glucose/arabinose dehydrogenase